MPRGVSTSRDWGKVLKSSDFVRPTGLHFVSMRSGSGGAWGPASAPIPSPIRFPVRRLSHLVHAGWFVKGEGWGAVERRNDDLCLPMRPGSTFRSPKSAAQAVEGAGGIFRTAPNVDRCRPMLTSESQESVGSPDVRFRSARSGWLLRSVRSHFSGSAWRCLATSAPPATPHRRYAVPPPRPSRGLMPRMTQSYVAGPLPPTYDAPPVSLGLRAPGSDRSNWLN